MGDWRRAVAASSARVDLFERSRLSTEKSQYINLQLPQIIGKESMVFYLHQYCRPCRAHLQNRYPHHH